MKNKILQSLLSTSLALEVQKSKCPFGFDAPAKQTELAQTKSKDIFYPSQVFSSGVTTTPSMDKTLYEDIVKATVDIYEGIDATVSTEENPRSQFVGCLLRLAGHDLMDFRVGEENTGGSDGCIHFEDEDNTGLPSCIENFGLPALYDQFSSQVSLADFFVIIAEAAIGRVATDKYSETYDADTYFDDESTFAAGLRNSFKYGRTTAATCDWNIGRMPNPEHGCDGKGEGKDGVEQIFVDNIFAASDNPWAMTAAISGAHTIGSTKLENSGYQGFWSDTENSGIFNNDYYKSLALKGWMPQTAVNGNTAKNLWVRADMARNNTSGAHQEIMLTSDMCLVYRGNERLSYCHDEETDMGTNWQQSMHECLTNYMMYKPPDLDPTEAKCCAWTKLVPLYSKGVLDYISEPVDFCGISYQKGDGQTHPQNDACCEGMMNFEDGGDYHDVDCDHKYWPTGPAFEDVADFVKNEVLWLKTFAKAWHMGTENGNDGLSFLDTDLGPERETLTDDEAYDCYWSEETSSLTMKKFTNRRDQCEINIIGRRTEYLQKTIKGSFNANRLVTDQRREYLEAEGYDPSLNALWYQYRGYVWLDNASLSSTSGDLVASKALNRQLIPNTTAELEASEMPHDWGVKGWNSDGANFKSSCAMTDENQESGYHIWQADFKYGEATVQRIEIMTTREDRDQNLGAQIYIGDTHVATFGDQSDRDAKFIRTSVFQWVLDEPVTGSSITIGGSSQIAVCDVRVFTNLEPGSPLSSGF